MTACLSRRMTPVALLVGAVMAGNMAAAQEKALDTVVVTASGLAQQIKEAPASISVITREDLDKAPVSSLAEVLGTLPGVVGGYAAAGAGSKISLRGMPDKYTLILVDGKRIGSSALLGHRPDTLKQDLNWLSPEDIERIEVVRGAMSTLYGSDAMGGVINIITKKVAKKWGGSLSTNFSTPDTSLKGDTLQNNFSVSGPVAENVGLRIGGSHLKRDSDSALRGASGSKEENINAKLNWQANADHSFTLEGSQGVSRSLEYPNERVAGATKEIFGAGKMKHQNFALGHEGRFSNLNTKLDFYVNTYKNESGVASAFDGGESKESVIDFKLDKPLKLGVDQLISGGLQYKKEEVNNPSNIGNLSKLIVDNGGQPVSVEKNPKATSFSGFIEDQLFLRENLTLTLGLRGDKSDGFDLNLSPRSYVVYHPADAWTLRGGVSQGYRAPNLKESSSSSATTSNGRGCASLRPLGYAGGVCYMAGNPNLKPEKSTNYEVGLGYDHAGYVFGVTYFQSTIKNMMQNGALGKVGQIWMTQQYNIEAGETAGIETNFAFPLSNTIAFSGNLTYMLESKNKTTGARLLMTPKLTGNATVKVRLDEKITTFATVQHIGKQLYAPASGSVGSFQNSNTTLDVGMNYAAHKNLDLKAGVKNLTNNVATTNDDYGDGNGKNYYVGLTAKF